MSALYPGTYTVTSFVEDSHLSHRLAMSSLPSGKVFVAAVTDREDAASEQRNRQQLDVLFNQASVGIARADLDGRLTLVNQRFCDMLGRPAEQLIGQLQLALTHPEDREANAVQFQRLLSTGEPYTVEKRFLRPEGAIVWVNNHVSLARDEAGRPDFLICVSQDITDRKHVEERLREQEEQLRFAQEAGGVGLFTLDVAASTLSVTPGFCQVYGVEWVERMPVATIEALLLPEDLHLTSPTQLRREGRVSISVDYRIRHGFTGEVRWISRRARMVLDAQGNPSRLLGVVQDVTERRKTEDALRDANERFRLTLDAGTVLATWDWDVRANRLIGDERLARTFSLEPDVARRGLDLNHYLRAIHPEDRPAVEVAVIRTLKTRAPYRIEYRTLRPDDTFHWLEATGTCTFDPQGQPLRFTGLIIDIDERKRAELRHAALVEIGDRLRDLNHTADIAGTAMEVVGKLLGVLRAGYGSIDARQEYVDMERDWRVGPGVASVTGVHRFADYGVFVENLKRGETVAIPDIERDPRTSDGADNLRALGIRALLNVPLMEKGRLVAVLYLHGAQERRWTGEEIAFVRNAADRVWSASERVKAMAQLKRANETLEQRVQERTRERDRVWSVSQELLAVTEWEGRILSVNPAWTTLLGWTPEELLGRTTGWLEHPDDRTRTQAERVNLTQGELTQRFEHRLRHRDGTYRLLSWTAVPIPGDQLVYASARDVTEQRQTEEQLRQSQKMEAVGNLTGGVAHDFNNLLQVISGNLQLLQRDVAGNERGLRHVQTAIGSVERGARLAAQLLAFARRQPLAPVVLHLGRLLHGMDELLRRSLGENVAVETVIGGGLWNTSVDPNQLENVILNLGINARDAMEGTGKLTLEVSNAMLDDHYALMHPEVRPGQYVLLAVSDTGSGMSPEVLERAFEPFFTTKAEGRGTGLGLSMVYGFVKQSEGHVKIYSEPGHGTTLKIYLPRTLEAEQPRVAETTGPVEGGSETILVVEDDPEVRATVVELLTELGYRVLKAQDGQSALAVLQSGLPVDLLFTDVVMPGPVRSPDLARQARALVPDLEVLFTSGYTENAIVHGGRLDPGVHLLSKPHRGEELARKLRQLLDHRQQKLAARSPPPMRTPEPAPPPEDEDMTEPGRLRVLLVEDDNDIRDSAFEMMDILEHEVVATVSAEAARDALAQRRFDVLFTDVTLPGVSGVALAREVKAGFPSMHIVIASGYGGAALEDRTGLEDILVLPKPYTLAQIRAVLEKVLARGVPKR